MINVAYILIGVLVLFGAVAWVIVVRQKRSRNAVALRTSKVINACMLSVMSTGLLSLLDVFAYSELLT